MHLLLSNSKVVQRWHLPVTSTDFLFGALGLPSPKDVTGFPVGLLGTEGNPVLAVPGLSFLAAPGPVWPRGSLSRNFNSGLFNDFVPGGLSHRVYSKSDDCHP